jgi:putative peptide zinc metalloprotease protein
MTQLTNGGANAMSDPDGTVPPPVLTNDSRLELVDLSIVEQDGGFIVGDPPQGVFVQLPQIGVTAIEHLRTSASIAEVTAMLRAAADSAVAGEPWAAAETADPAGDVDVLDFANTLLELGFVTAVDGTSTSTSTSTGFAAPARRWLTGPRPERIRWLFSRPAWLLYFLLFASCFAIEIVSPTYRPHPSDYFFLSDSLASFAILTVISFATVGVHECFHWLAASAQGVSARFAISRRLYFLVFETDLTQLWSLPRQRRYGPLLAGMAFDTMVLAATLAGRLLITSGAVSAPPAVGHILAAVAILVTTNLAWQFCIFLRNDLYLVLSNLLGCVNLWRIAMLIVKKTAWRLTPDEQAELASAGARNRWHARWYSWLCVAGVAGAAWYAAYVIAPMIWRVIRSLANHLTSLPPTSPRFWEAVAFGALALLPLLLVLHVLIRDTRNARRRPRNLRPETS